MFPMIDASSSSTTPSGDPALVQAATMRVCLQARYLEGQEHPLSPIVYTSVG